MENRIKDAKKYYNENYYDSDITARIKNQVHSRILAETVRKKWSSKTKIVYSASAAVIVFGLLIGSLFVSPTMAEVAAKIPYLNQILQLKPLNEVLGEELLSNGYHVEGIGIAINGKKEIEVQVKDADEKIKTEIKMIINKELEARGYDAYTVTIIEPYHPNSRPVELTSKEKLVEGILEEARLKLKENNYNILTYGYGIQSPNMKGIEFYVDIPNTEQRVEEIKKIFNQIVEGKDIGEYSIKVKSIDLKQQEIENKWSAVVFPVIIDGMMGKKEFEVTGFAYSFHPSPLEIILKTSIKSTDEDAKERAIKIEETVEEFLKSNELKEVVETYPYEVIVRSKDQKQIN